MAWARDLASRGATEANAADIGAAALEAALRLDDERTALYADLVFNSVTHAAARKALEALMANGKYEYQSEFAKRYVAQGRTEGLAEAVLCLFGARGLAVSDDLRARVQACKDVAMLKRWLDAAMTSRSAAEAICE